MRYLVTSALPYINGIKHLGNLAGSILPADIYSRFRRMQGHEVLFICATDEHGTPAELAAQEAGMEVQAYCDKQHQMQKDIYKSFNLSFDCFGRTSAQQNHELTQHFAQKLEENGLLEERKTKQVFSVDDNRFLPDRYVEGTCPSCGYESARGDQCDGCGRLLDPVELINPRSKVSGSTNIEIRETAHLFLRQSQMEEKVAQWVDASEKKWPPLATSIARKWLKEGLKDRSITRDLAWGVKVLDKDGNPREGFENKVFYVWFDAPIGYIAAAKEWADQTGGDWERWWLNDKGADDVDYVQFMGKDNVAFHTISFPITILGSGEDWKTVDHLKAFNWVNWYGDKFSTSQKRGVFMDQALSLLPSDYWRWYLMANAPESSDFSFTWETFQTTCNADLSNNFGNFVNRIGRFAASKFDKKVPVRGALEANEDKMFLELNEALGSLKNFYEQNELRKAASEVRKIWSIGNEYLATAAPWTEFKTNPDRAATIVNIGLNICVLSAMIAQPFIPDTADKILNAFGVSTDQVIWPEKLDTKTLSYLTEDAEFEVPPVLFERIEDTWVEEQTAAFSGS